MNHQEAAAFVKEILEALRLMVAKHADGKPIYGLSCSAMEIDVWRADGRATVLRIVAKINPSHSLEWVVHGRERVPTTEEFAEFVLTPDTWRQELSKYLQ